MHAGDITNSCFPHCGEFYWRTGTSFTLFSLNRQICTTTYLLLVFLLFETVPFDTVNYTHATCKWLKDLRLLLNSDSVSRGTFNAFRRFSLEACISKRRVSAILASSSRSSGFSKAFCTLLNNSTVDTQICMVNERKKMNVIKPNIIQFYLSDWFLLCTIRFMTIIDWFSIVRLDFQSSIAIDWLLRMQTGRFFSVNRSFKEVKHFKCGRDYWVFSKWSAQNAQR